MAVIGWVDPVRELPQTPTGFMDNSNTCPPVPFIPKALAEAAAVEWHRFRMPVDREGPPSRSHPSSKDHHGGASATPVAVSGDVTGRYRLKIG